jgi:predicted DNA-binding transcriptional regulator YafY
MEYPKAQKVTINYTNWEGKTADRNIFPLKIWFGTTNWHLEEQWLLKAFDLDKGEERDFSLKDIHSWK